MVGAGPDLELGERVRTVEIRLTGHGVEQFATPLVIGRRLLPADLEFLTTLHGTDKTMAHYGGVRSKTSTEPFVRSNVAHWRHFQFGLYVLSTAADPDVPIGRAGLRWIRDQTDDPVVDVSVVLDADSWGNGYATEASRAIVSIGRSLELPLIAECETDHDAARRVVQKVGFVFHSHSTRHGQPCDRYRWPVEAENTGKSLSGIVDV